MKTAFAYIRVSTQKQGSEGASLPEQRDSIQRYCDRNNLHIIKWYQETETAAKRGRPLFTEMLKQVKKGKADSLVFHKIDRSTRNLGEWAEVSSLPEIGIEVHYSHEPVDLSTNHGRTAADVAAVFASAFIRNLREETKKGIVGRLKQGLYPFKAPVGYLDNGGQKPKTIDPVKGPLIKTLFERYATGEYSFHDILRYADSHHLLGYRDTPISPNGLSKIFKNPFYKGIIYIQKYQTFYPGIHEALISHSIFEKVQKVITGRVVARKTRTVHLFQKMLTCATCGYRLIGESHRGIMYYRCHKCKGHCVRESALNEMILSQLKNLSLSKSEIEFLKSDIQTVSGIDSTERKTLIRSTNLQLDAIDSRLRNLTDAYLEHDISKPDYEERKGKLISERMAKEIEKEALKYSDNGFEEKLKKNVEQVISLQDQYKLGNREKKRLLLKSATSNILVFQKNPDIIWVEPFKTLLFRGGTHGGGRITNPSCMTSESDTQETISNQGEKQKVDFFRKMKRSRSTLTLVAKVIYERVTSGQDYIYPHISPPPPSAPSNQTWRENFKRK
jgi:site-specific DNA recombinase